MSTQQQHAWLARYVSPLIGATIVSVRIEVGDYDEGWVVLEVKTKDGLTHNVEVSRDFEGNGPGALLGLPRPEPTLKLKPESPEQEKKAKAKKR